MASKQSWTHKGFSSGRGSIQFGTNEWTGNIQGRTTPRVVLDLGYNVSLSVFLGRWWWCSFAVSWTIQNIFCPPSSSSPSMNDWLPNPVCLSSVHVLVRITKDKGGRSQRRSFRSEWNKIFAILFHFLFRPTMGVSTVSYSPIFYLPRHRFNRHPLSKHWCKNCTLLIWSSVAGGFRCCTRWMAGK